MLKTRRRAMLNINNGLPFRVTSRQYAFRQIDGECVRFYLDGNDEATADNGWCVTATILISQDSALAFAKQRSDPCHRLNSLGHFNIHALRTLELTEKEETFTTMTPSVGR